jgi:hypothetical protein
MTARDPATALRAPTRAARPPAPAPADAGDRVFVTLLSLNFMLLAFFVVLGTAASVDAPRAATIARAVRLQFAAPADEGGVRKVTASQAFHAGVSEALAPAMPPSGRVSIDNADRADVTVPADAFAAAAPDLLESVARLLRAAPSGLRYELVIDGNGAEAFVEGLIARGVPASLLLLGAAADSDDLRLSFVMLDADDDAIAGATRAAGAR